MRRRSIVGLVAVLVVAVWGLGAPAAGAAPAGPSARVTILSPAMVTDGGATLTVRLVVRCRADAADGVQWEGFVSARQGDVFGWAGLPLVCDGRSHLVHAAVPVSAPEGTAAFTRGTAEVTAVVQDENTLTTYADDARTVRVLAMRHHGGLTTHMGPGGATAGHVGPMGGMHGWRAP